MLSDGASVHERTFKHYLPGSFNDLCKEFDRIIIYVHCRIHDMRCCD